MTSQRFLKLIALLTIFVSLTSISMDPQKRSVNEIYGEIRDHRDRYSDTYKWDMIDLMKEMRANNIANIVSIFEQMADKISTYSQEDIRNFLSFVQSYAEELYTNELIGLLPFGTLAKHQSILCHIQVLCDAKLNAINETVTRNVVAEPGITQKSHSIKKSATISVEKEQSLEPANFSSFAKIVSQSSPATADRSTKDMQKKINVIARARILGDLQQKNINTGMSPKSLNKASRIWSEKLVKALKDALARKDENLINRLWRANFNDNNAHFKAREKDLYERIIERLEKDKINKNDITWFRERISKLVHKKEVHFALKSKQENKSADTSKASSTSKPSESKPTSDSAKIVSQSSPAISDKQQQSKPQVNAAQTIGMALNQLQRAITHEDIQAALKNLLDIQITGTFNANESVVLKNQIEEVKQHIYQNCMLGLYGNHEQKLQLNIFDMCAYELTDLRVKLSKHLKESDKEVENYTNQADKSRQQCLYEIKVIRNPEKIREQDGAAWKSRDRDVATWQTIVQDKLSANVERQNAPVIQQIINANFDATKTPVLAENHANVVQNVKNMFNGGKDKANSAWIDNHANIFNAPLGAAQNGQTGEPQAGGMPNPPMPNPPAEGPSSTSFYQTCKNHWVLSSLALGAVVTGIYYLWEEWNAEEKNDDVKPVEKEQAKANDEKAKKEEQATADKKSTQETNSSKKAAVNKKTKTNTAKQAKTA